ncbi:Diacylglycerol kinase-related protein [Actinomycetales bacterium JB111]|nr:Diacylglycerol kinase-related protein [Actinomycetales bacterium JB111]
MIGARRRIGLVINPSAGTGRGEQVASDVRAALDDDATAVVDLTDSDALGAAARAREAVTAGSIDALVVVGGDGMAHLGINVVAGTPVPLGLVSVGSGNDLARALGLPMNDHAASLALVRAALDPAHPVAAPRQLDAIRVTPAPGPGEPRSIGIVPDSPHVRWAASSVVVGFAAAVNLAANSYRRPRGSAKYLRAVVAETARFTPYGMATSVDGEPWSGPATLLTLANAPLFGGGLPVAPDAVPDDGLMDVVHIDAVGRAQISTLFPRFARGTHVSLDQVTITRAAEVVVGQSPEHGRALPIAMADGESVGPLPLAATIVPSAWRLLAPLAPNLEA